MLIKLIVHRCPKCGGKGRVYKNEKYNEYRVKCDKCGFMTTPYIGGDTLKLRNDAVKEWETLCKHKERMTDDG